MKDEEIKQLGKWFKRHEWRFAKSMPKYPHWYITRDTSDSSKFFTHACELIELYGVTEYFYKTPRKYLYIGPYKYWTMGAPPESTIVINRCAKDDFYG